MHNKNFLKKKLIPTNSCGFVYCRCNGAPAQSRSKKNISNSC